MSFAGDANCWEATNAVANVATLPVVAFANATAATFDGLKSVRVTFDAKPSLSRYYLTDAVSGLTAAQTATVTVTDGVNDYSDKFSLSVKDGRLVLDNSASNGFIIVIQ